MFLLLAFSCSVIYYTFSSISYRKKLKYSVEEEFFLFACVKKTKIHRDIFSESGYSKLNLDCLNCLNLIWVINQTKFRLVHKSVIEKCKLITQTKFRKVFSVKLETGNLKLGRSIGFNLTRLRKVFPVRLKL